MKTKFPIPKNEKGRLKALKEYNLDQLVEKEEFMALTRLAARIADVPMTLINFVDSDSTWSLAGFGAELQDNPREESACQYTVLKDEPHEIEDLREHPQLKNHSHVTGEPKLRYYCGVPLTTDNGFVIGSLCMYHTKVNKLTSEQLQSLNILADEIIARLDLRLSQKELKQLNAQKDEILHIVSHDMRNPLSGIIGIANLVMRKSVDEEELKSYMGMIKESADHLLRNVNELLDVSFIESGSMQLDPSLINIKEVTLDTVELHRSAANVKDIMLNTQLEITKGEGAYDEVRYEQILGNLITNAVKFTPSGGTVTVGVCYPTQAKAEHARELKLQVEDTGVGIPQKFMDILFTKYGKHGRKGTAGEKSIGLGLPLLKKLVDAHEGRIEVESEEGKGTTFTVYLPTLKNAADS